MRTWLSSLRVLTLIAALSLTACTKERGELGSSDNPIKMFFLPSVDTKTLSEKAMVVQEYLESNTPYKFKVSVPSSYVAVVEAFGTNRADIAAINTFGYILAHEKYGVTAKLTVVRFGKDTYQAQIIARADSSIKGLPDLNGKKVAFVDPASTSGYLLPAKMFMDKNIKPKETVFAQKHDSVVTMVYQKQVDAGATFHSPTENGKIQDARRLVTTQFPDVAEKIKIVDLTDPVPNDPIVFRKDMSPEMVQKIADSLVAFIKTETGKKTFYDLYGVTDFKATTDSTYDGVREMLKKLGKSAAELTK